VYTGSEAIIAVIKIIEPTSPHQEIFIYPKVIMHNAKITLTILSVLPTFLFITTIFSFMSTKNVKNIKACFAD
jgi:hypothetical protein